VRKSHNDGWKHKAAVRAYYQQFEEEHHGLMGDPKGSFGSQFRYNPYAMPPPPMFPGRGMPPPMPMPPFGGNMPMMMPPMLYPPPMAQGQGNIPTPQTNSPPHK